MCIACQKIAQQRDDATRRGDYRSAGIYQDMLNKHLEKTCSESRVQPARATLAGIWPGGKRAYVKEGKP